MNENNEGDIFRISNEMDSALLREGERERQGEVERERERERKRITKLNFKGYSVSINLRLELTEPSAREVSIFVERDEYGSNLTRFETERQS